jgi:hypothetical protein
MIVVLSPWLSIRAALCPQKTQKWANNSYLPLWTGLRVAFPCFIPMRIGAQPRINSGTDMLEHYGDFGTY